MCILSDSRSCGFVDFGTEHCDELLINRSPFLSLSGALMGTLRDGGDLTFLFTSADQTF